MGYYLKILIAVFLSAIITVVIFSWTIKLTALNKTIIFSFPKVDVKLQDLYKNYCSKYKRVVILKDGKFTDLGLRTIESLSYDAWSNYFVVETSNELSAKFIYWIYFDKKVLKDTVDFNISSGRHYYHTLHRGYLIAKAKNYIFNDVIVGLSQKRFKLEKNRPYYHSFKPDERNQWIGIDVYNNRAHLLFSFTPKSELYLAIKDNNRRFVKFNNNTQQIKLQVFAPCLRGADFSLNECCELPYGQLFVKNNIESWSEYDRNNLNIYIIENPFNSDGIRIKWKHIAKYFSGYF
jgi:hypothetical protein